MKDKTPLLVWGASLALFVLSVVVLGASLPERVATHAVWLLTLVFVAGTAGWVVSLVRFFATTGRTESA